MKFCIDSNLKSIKPVEVILYDRNIISEIIKREIHSKFKDENKTLEFLIEKVTSLEGYNKNNVLYNEDDTINDKIKSLLYYLEVLDYKNYISTALKAARNQKSNFSLLIIILHNIFANANYKYYNSIVIIPKEEIKYFVSLIYEASKDDLLDEKLYSVTDILLSGDKKIQERSSKLLSYTELVKEKFEKIEYLVIQDPDDSMENINKYLKIKEIKLSNFLFTDGFKEFLGDDFDDDSISNIEEYLLEYIEESVVPDNFFDDIAKHIINQKESQHIFDENSIKSLKLDNESIIDNL